MKTIKRMKQIGKILFIAITLIVVGCDKESGHDIPNGTVGYNSMEGFFEENGVKAQEFAIDASVGGTITGEEGTEVTIPANAFLNADGTLATGNVKIEIKEVFNASQMILSNRPTNAIDQSGVKTFLLSEGETQLVASKDGANLSLNQEAPVFIQVPAKASEDSAMLPFDGEEDDEAGIIWGVGKLGREGITYDSSPASYKYRSFVTGWTNCDRFYSYPGDKTTNYVNLGTSPNSSETSVFITFKENGLPAVVKIFTRYTDGVMSYPNLLPVGLEVTFVAICVHENQQYMATFKKDIAEDDIVSFDFSPVSSEELVSNLESLD